MRIGLETRGSADFETPLLTLVLTQGASVAEDALSGAAKDLVDAALRSGDFEGRNKDSLVIYPPGASTRVLLLGVGPKDELDAETLRGAAGRAVRAAENSRCTSLTMVIPEAGDLSPQTRARALTEGAILASWRYREDQEPDKDDPPDIEEVTFLASGKPDEFQKGIDLGAAGANGENLARTLQSRPANRATPTHLAKEARALAERTGMKIEVLGRKKMRKEGMHALLAVAQGSAEPPKMIVLRYQNGLDRPAIALVGKAISFDAGGISLKPSPGMEEMKYDMSGGAAVIGAMAAIAAAELPVNVVGVVPSAENLPSGTAVKPGDVIGSLAGKTIEVINTDAEGRLILADALAYTARMEPAAMVDCATLTGSVVVALGHHASGVMGTDEDLIAELREAGENTGERCWPLPLWKPYRKQLDSDFADLKNVGGRPGGSITAGSFLKEFTGEVPWAHLDIAGTAYGKGEAPYHRKGALGVPTRLLFEWVRSRSG